MASKNSTKKQVSVHIYPVWAGNLHDNVTEAILKQRFSGFGSVDSCKIMTDNRGKSKNFGYVNFTVKSIAENAARKLNGCDIEGKPVKTKGPTELRKEGHLKRSQNYRPLTDCTFFINGKGCTKGDECPYRHSEKARQQDEVCKSWKQRSCIRKSCPRRHPRLSQSENYGSSSNIPLLMYSNSDAKLDITVSDSDESFDYSFDDSNSELSLSYHSSDSPSPLKHDGANRPFSKGLNSKTDIPYDSTQSFTMSSDEEDNLEESDFKHNDFDLYDSNNSSGNDDDDDDGNMGSGWSPQSTTRLLSLTASDITECRENEYEEDEELSNNAEVPNFKVSSKKQQKDSGRQIKNQNSTNPPPLEPVGLFWDIENCQVPIDKSAFALANKMRQIFFQGKREAEFMCVCDITKERKEVADDLHRAHVTLVHVNAIAKNAADDKLKHSLRRFAQTFHPPATVVLVSGDVNFSFELNDLRHVHNMTTILVHNEYTSDALKVCAHQTVLFEDFIKDVGPQQRFVQPIPTVLIVYSLPPIEPWKIKNRLSRLADNCGGRVLNVDPGSRTSRILFRSREYAMKARKRMTGEDVYGTKIKIEIEEQNTPKFHPIPRQSFPRSPQPRPSYPPVRPPLMRPHYLGGRGPPVPQYLPQHPTGGFPPPPQHHPFSQPRHPGRFPPAPPRPLPVNNYQQQPIFKMFIKGLSTSNEVEFDNLTAIFTEIRLSVNIKSCLPEFFWESFSTACLVSDFQVIETIEMRKLQPFLQMLHSQGHVSFEAGRKLFEICLNDINRKCQQLNVPWNVSVCQWSPEEEGDRRILSNVVSLLKKYDKHWAKLEKFKNLYAEKYDCAISEMMIQHCCGNVIQLLSASKSDTVIMFTEFSPLIRIKKTEEFIKNSLSLVQSFPESKIKLIEFVETYQGRFGKLNFVSGRKGSDLQEIFSSCPPFFVSGVKPSSLLVELKTSSASPVSNHRQDYLEVISVEFIQLLKETPGQQIALTNLQQSYQTKYHKSFRVSDIVAGASGMRTLIEACRGIKCITMQYGKRKETIVVLVQQQPSSASCQEESHPVPSGDSDPIERFKKDLTELLNTMPEKRLQLSRIPEEYCKHFEKPYLLTSYGGKKTALLIKSIPEAVLIDIEGDERIAYLIGAENTDTDKTGDTAANDTNDCGMTKQQCEKKIEDLLYSLPNHQTTLDRLLYDYEALFKEKLTNYCGHSKLLLLLQEMNSTIVITGTGARRTISLHPLRLFACRMKELLSYYPHGMKLSSVVPEYTQKFKTEFHADKYGKQKLLQVMETITDVVKITGDGPRRIVSLLNPPLPAQFQTTKEIQQMFLDEITSLLLSYPSNKLTLDKLSAKYYNTFNKQINFGQLGCTSLLEAVKSLPNVKVTGEGVSAVIQLIAEEIVAEGVECRQSDDDQTESQPIQSRNLTEQLVKETDTSGSQSSLGQFEEERPDLIDNPVPPKPRLRLCETICIRLLSEMHRILLCHHEHSMTLEELCTSFKDTEEPSQPTPTDLIGAIETYAGKKSQYKFNVSKVMEDMFFVSLTHADAIWKLSKDLQYVFVYSPCSDYTMSLHQLTELYKTCHGHRLNPMVYKCQSLEKLMTSKQLKQIIKFDEETKSVSLLLKSRLEVFCQLSCEMLFRMESDCGNVVRFMSCYEWYFETPLSLSDLEADSIQTLLTLPEVTEFIKLLEDKNQITLTSRGLYCEQLRHLLTAHNGRIPQGLLLTMYLSEFRHPQDHELLSWLHKKPIRYASHVVHLAAEFYIIWAPTGHPYPDTRAEKQSRMLPEDRSVTVNELGTVPEILDSVINELLPPTSITLDIMDAHDLLRGMEMPALIDDSSTIPVTTDTRDKDILGLPDLVTLELTETNQDSSNKTLSKNDTVTGLDHGEFAGMSHQTVLERMQLEMRSEQDSRSKLQRMGDFIDYFGELSGLEIERVDGPPVPKPRKLKGKSRLAIQFPGPSSSFDSNVSDEKEEKSTVSPKISPILGDRQRNGGKLDCLPQSNTMGILNQGMFDWEQQLVDPTSGANDTYGKEGSHKTFSLGNSSSEWPSFKK